MGTPRFTPEFKEEAVKQVTERGYSVSEVAARIGVSAHSLYKWVKSVSPDKGEQQTKDLLEANGAIFAPQGKALGVESLARTDVENIAPGEILAREQGLDCRPFMVAVVEVEGPGLLMFGLERRLVCDAPAAL